MIKVLSIAEVEYIAHVLAKRWMDWGEPIPDFSTRYPNKLESCLATPFQTFGNKELYKGLGAKAAILFYLLIKNHPFQNGNKRIAVASLLVFLDDNNRWLKVDNVTLYNFAVWVAESSPTVKDQVIAAIEVFLKKYIVMVDM